MTDQQKSLSRKYLVYKVFTNLWFLSAVWLYFYRIFITDQQVGILDSIAFAIGLIFEVPSGALADKFGRDKVVKLGHILSGSGLILQGISSSFVMFVIGQSIMMIGISFVSGANDALFFENLNFDKNSTNWRKLVTRSSQVALIASLAATLSGGYLHEINVRIPWVLTGTSLAFSTIVIWSVKDDRLKKERGKFFDELNDYFEDIKIGFSQFKSKNLWFYVLFIIAVEGLFYTFGYGILKMILLDRFDFSPSQGSVVLAFSSIATILILYIFNKYIDKISEKLIFIAIGIAAALALIFSNFEIGIFGAFVILVIYAGEHLLTPILSEVLNNNSPEEKRATVLSVASFLKTLPYIGLAPLIGYLSTVNKLEYFFTAWAVLIFGSLVLYIVFKRKDTKVEIPE